MNPTDEQLRIMVAEALGWTVRDNLGSAGGVVLYNPHGLRTEGLWANAQNAMGAGTPNYPADLNACAEFEKVLLSQSYINRRSTPFHAYFEKLHQQCVIPYDQFDKPLQAEHWAVCATARQRCIAFLKVKGVLKC